MAGLRDLLKKEKDYDRQALEAAEVLRAKTPYVAEILGGSKGSATEEPISPGTITFFFREGKWRFSANVKSASKTFIGDLVDIASPWDSVNYALESGDCRQKDYTERPNGSNGVPPY